MAFIFHEPRRRHGSSEPRIILSPKFISINPACVEKYFGGKEHVRIGYDKSTQQMIFIPIDKTQKGGMKLVPNPNSQQRYIKAEKLYEGFGLTMEKAEYQCSWDAAQQGVLINLEKDKV